MSYYVWFLTIWSSLCMGNNAGVKDIWNSISTDHIIQIIHWVDLDICKFGTKCARNKKDLIILKPDNNNSIKHFFCIQLK